MNQQQFEQLLDRVAEQLTNDCSWRLAGYGTVEFQNGRFRRYRASKGGPPHALGQKQKLKALSLKKVVPTFVPEAGETRHGVTWRHSARDGAENWVQLE